MNNKQIQHSVNEIAKFLAVRDIDKLDCKELEKCVGLKKVDVLVLLGNSIPYTIKCAADAYKNNLCDRILIHYALLFKMSLNYNNLKPKEKKLLIWDTILKSQNIMVIL